MPTESEFEIMEHTADAGLVLRGQDLPELFRNAARGMFSLMVDIEGVQEREERSLVVSARDVESLLLRWLSELLYYVDSQQMLFRRFDILEASDTRLRARAFGETIDRDRHELKLGIKAITRHMLDVVKEDGRYRATVLFDI